MFFLPRISLFVLWFLFTFLVYTVYPTALTLDAMILFLEFKSTKDSAGPLVLSKKIKLRPTFAATRRVF